MLQVMKEAGWKMTKEIFELPGGYLFQFKKPDGIELAAWPQKQNWQTIFLLPGQLVAKAKAATKAECEVCGAAGDAVNQTEYAAAMM